MSTNGELAEIFGEIANLLDLAGERFKPDAYRRAARSLESLTEDVRAVEGRGELDAIPGVGAAISEKIREYLKDGSIAYYERLRREMPPGLLEIMRLPGIGPKTARRFWTELGVEGPQELSAAIAAGRLVGLKGFGPRKIELIEKALAPNSAPTRRIPLRAALRLAEQIVTTLRATAPLEAIEVAGSLRRARESVGDLDILVTSHEPEDVFDAFTALPMHRSTVLRGPTKETILVEGDVQVDLRVVEPAAFGAALQYFTGSKDHNVRLRSMARDRGLKINEYGVFRGEERIAGATEREVYATVGLPLIPPELREDQGEIASAGAGTLPKLLEADELRGDLHVHVADTMTDEEISGQIARARARRWEYLGLILTPATAEAKERWRTRAGDAIRILFGEELSSWKPPTAPRGAGAPDYRVLRADLAGPPPASSSIDPTDVSPVLVAHLRTGTEGAAADSAIAAPWLTWAERSGSALEVGPSGAEGGLDAPLVHRLMERGGRIHVSGLTVDVSTGRAALGTARRGWATKERTLNAAALPGLGLPARRERPTGH